LIEERNHRVKNEQQHLFPMVFYEKRELMNTEELIMNLKRGPNRMEASLFTFPSKSPPGFGFYPIPHLKFYTIILPSLRM
jgi:hypothetical protein